MSLLKDFTDLGNFYADKGGNRPYLEKRSNAYLDDFTRNAGSNNYTKFARDVDRVGTAGMSGTAMVCGLSVLEAGKNTRAEKKLCKIIGRRFL